MSLPPGGAGLDRASTIASVLQANIASGHYGAGDRLPSEADLCAHFDVSRPTLREALGRLSALGLIVSRRGSGGGSFVARPDAGLLGGRIAALVSLVALQDETPLALTLARLHVQIGCAHLAALARSDITDLRAEIDLQSDFSLSAPTFAGSCQRMHLAVCAASGNPALSMLGQALVEAEFSRSQPERFETRERARLLSYHVRLANGIGGGRPDDTRAALMDLMAYETDRATALPADAQPGPDRPPRMRDLRLPRVQRLTGTPDAEGGDGTA
jgi:GntR family transcriptional regulator, transcriptional repressor for pyruvate dehydrogenase complex